MMSKEKYQMALDTLFMMSSEHLGFELNYEKNLMQELIDAKFEEESRKNHLIVGSEWECNLDNKVQEFGNYKPHVENLKKGLIVEVFNVNGLIIFGHNKSMESWVVGEEQFLACFKPLKEGEEL